MAAQELHTVPKITQFNGGLHTARAAHLISANEAVTYSDINHIKGTLSPIKSVGYGQANVKQWGHYFTTDAEWYWSDTPKDWVEFQERLYIGNRTGVSTKVIASVEQSLGIEPPTVKPIGTPDEETPAEDVISRIQLTPFKGGTHAPTADIPVGGTLRYKAYNISTFGAGAIYPADNEFTVLVTSEYNSSDPLWEINWIQCVLTDSNIKNEIALFRFFDNSWRKLYQGPPTYYTDEVYDISANDDDSAYERTALEGVYQYALTFFNSIDGTESAPVISDEIIVDKGYVLVTALEVSLDPQVDQKKLYRIGGTSTAFTLVTILTNATVSYSDELADDELEGSLLQSSDNFPPVENLHYMMENYAMLFAADGDKLRFTPIGEPDYWPQTYYLDFPRTITGIAKTPMGILVFNVFETWLVTGSGPLSLSQQLLSGSQGCINGDTVVNLEGAAWWVSTDGVCISDGGQVQIITDDKLGKLDLSNSVNAVVYDEQYYLLVEEGIQSLIVDLRRQVIKYNRYAIISFIKAEDVLYGVSSDTGVDLHTIEDNASFFNTFIYLSPEYIGKGFTTPKLYKNIYMYCSGIINVNVYIDGDLVQQDAFTEEDNHQIKIPSELTRGFKLQFGIYGTGTVYEIQWEEGDASQ